MLLLSFSLMLFCYSLMPSDDSNANCGLIFDNSDVSFRLWLDFGDSVVHYIEKKAKEKR